MPSVCSCLASSVPPSLIAIVPVKIRVVNSNLTSFIENLELFSFVLNGGRFRPISLYILVLAVNLTRQQLVKESAHNADRQAAYRPGGGA